MPTREHIRKHIDNRLRNRLRIYFLIGLILLGIVIYDIFMGYLSFTFAFVGMLVGIVLGIVTARMYHISWDHDAQKIVTKFDLFGGIILVLYVLFEIFRERIIETFTHGSAVGGVTIALFTGLMIGRILGTRGKIIRVLREQKVFE